MRRLLAVVAVLLAVSLMVVLGADASPDGTREDRLARELTLERAHHRAQLHRAHLRARALVHRVRLYRAGYAFTTDDTRKAAVLMGVLMGWPVAQSLRVARCESHLEPWARNSHGLGDGARATGSWQALFGIGLRSSTWHSTDVGRALPTLGDALNPYINAAVAVRVWQRNGGTFAEWNDVCAHA